MTDPETLQKPGVLRPDAPCTGPDLLAAAETFLEHERADQREVATPDVDDGYLERLEEEARRLGSLPEEKKEPWTAEREAQLRAFVLRPSHPSLGEFNKVRALVIDLIEDHERLRIKNHHDAPALEQARVQLAGCLLAAEGNATGANDAKKGDYGWSLAFEVTKRLRERAELLRSLLGQVRILAGEARAVAGYLDDDPAFLDHPVTLEARDVIYGLIRPLFPHPSNDTKEGKP